MVFWKKLFPPSSPEVFEAVREGDLEKVRTLLRDDPDLAFREFRSTTLLHAAAAFGH
jgi:hypothetical protein